MTTTFEVAALAAFGFALDAVNSGLDTQEGRWQLVDARHHTTLAIGAMQEGSVAEKAVAGHLLDMMRDLTAQALARV